MHLDDDINSKLKSWKLPENDLTREQKVTLRMLLNHSAGTTVSGFAGYPQDASVPTLVQLLDGNQPANSAAVRVDIKPGTQWRYSGGGISIAQLLVADTIGQPLAEFM